MPLMTQSQPLMTLNTEQDAVLDDAAFAQAPQVL